MSDCLFCRMGAGEIPVTPVDDDESLIVIEDIKPEAPLHVLVIPKAHIPSLNDLTAEHDALVGSMVRRAAAIARNGARIGTDRSRLRIVTTSSIRTNMTPQATRTPAVSILASRTVFDSRAR